VRELVGLAASPPGPERLQAVRDALNWPVFDAMDASNVVYEVLGGRDLRLTDEGLFVGCRGLFIQNLLAGTRWGQGKHADALLRIPGAIQVDHLVKFSPWSAPMPAVLVPLEAVRAAMPTSVDSASSGQEVQP
jgi:hypothetical protein